MQTDFKICRISVSSCIGFLGQETTLAWKNRLPAPVFFFWQSRNTDDNNIALLKEQGEI